MIGYFYDKYGLTILFYACLIALVFIFVYNLTTGRWRSSDGSNYSDHSKLIWNLVTMPWTATADSISQTVVDGFARPSPFVGESRGEAECRRAAESLTGERFPKCRPTFLRNSITGSTLELDCYCEALSVAVEYNGRQHYEFVPHFHASKEAFFNVKYRDDMKRRLCDANGVTLIVVPYTVDESLIENYLRERFVRLGIAR